MPLAIAVSVGERQMRPVLFGSGAMGRTAHGALGRDVLEIICVHLVPEKKRLTHDLPIDCFSDLPDRSTHAIYEKHQIGHGARCLFGPPAARVPFGAQALRAQLLRLTQVPRGLTSV